MSEVKEVELKACPFCAAEQDDFAGLTTDAFAKCSDGGFSVCCRCGAIGPTGATMAEAVTLWNTRPASTGKGEELRQLADDAQVVLTTLCARYGYAEDGITPLDWSEWQEARRVHGALADLLALPVSTSQGVGDGLESTSQSAIASAPSFALPDATRAGIYVASRASLAERGAMWRALRASGVHVTSSWIDEDGPGETADFAELWPRIQREVTSSERLVAYLEPDDFPVRGVLIEIGMALAAGVPVVIVAPNVALEGASKRPLGSWIAHPLVSFADTVVDAVDPPTSQQGAKGGAERSECEADQNDQAAQPQDVGGNR